jgi:hypothetical protein
MDKYPTWVSDKMDRKKNSLFKTKLKFNSFTGWLCFRLQPYRWDWFPFTSIGFFKYRICAVDFSSFVPRVYQLPYSDLHYRNIGLF